MTLPPGWLPAGADLGEDEQSPAGYAAVVRDLELDCLPHHHISLIAEVNRRRTIDIDGRTIDVYPSRQVPSGDLVSQLVFALRYDGVSLEVLAEAFRRMEVSHLVSAVREQPTSSYLRRLWFFFEWLTEKRLGLPDLDVGNYVEALPSTAYLTLGSLKQPCLAVRSRRHRVLDNLLGTRDWCPIVRRHPQLPTPDQVAGLAGEAWAMLEDADQDLLQRSIAYLYTKETKSSYLIEREEISGDRQQRFIGLLKHAHEGTIAPSKERLVELQQAIVEPRYREGDWRSDQNYVGGTQPDFSEFIHYLPPRPEDVPAMMRGFVSMTRTLLSPGSDAVVDAISAAAIVGFSFVFIHPFDDGNGRLHRFLIHQVLAQRGFTPRGTVLPVSAQILLDQSAYDASLESFSQPVMDSVSYRIDESDGTVEVIGDSGNRYRYLDLTRQVLDLYTWIATTIRVELPGELRLLVHWDQAMKAMDEVVDMPQRKKHLFITLCRQNGGRLSATKRARHFAELGDDEVQALEGALSMAFSDRTGNGRSADRS